MKEERKKLAGIIFDIVVKNGKMNYVDYYLREGCTPPTFNIRISSQNDEDVFNLFDMLNKMLDQNF